MARRCGCGERAEFTCRGCEEPVCLYCAPDHEECIADLDEEPEE